MTEQQLVAASNPLALMPVMDVAMAIARRRQIISLIKSELWVKGVDSGTVPGTDKETLLQPGAEKLTTFFGLTPRFLVVESVEDWTGKDHGGEPFFYYLFSCQLWHGPHMVAEASGSCNSYEAKYRYRWVSEMDVPPGLDKAMLKKRAGSIKEFTFAVEKGEMVGKYGKPAEHWQAFRDAIEAGTAEPIDMTTAGGKQLRGWQIDTTVFRIPNDDIASQVNTILKMAQKRALVAVTKLGVNVSDLFTQDLEDFEAGEIIEGKARVVEDKGRPRAPVPVGEEADNWNPDDDEGWREGDKASRKPEAKPKPQGNGQDVGKPTSQPQIQAAATAQKKPDWTKNAAERDAFKLWREANTLSDADCKRLAGAYMGQGPLQYFRDYPGNRAELQNVVMAQIAREGLEKPQAQPEAKAPVTEEKLPF